MPTGLTPGVSTLRPDTRRASVTAAAWLCACGALYAAQLRMFATTDDQDAGMHALYTRFPTHPGRVLSVFARPLFGAIYYLPGQLGYPAMRVFTIAVCLLTAWLTYRVARRLDLPFPWLTIPLVLLQPALYQLGAETMTEPLFALTLSAGTLALATGRPRVAALVWSLLPLARPEGPIVLAVVAVTWLWAAIVRRGGWQPILLLATGMVAWELAALLATGDPWYLKSSFPWAVDTAAVIHGSPIHYFARWPYIVGFGLLPLWVVGMMASWRQPLLRLAIVVTLAVFALHTYLWAAGRFASWGFDRYFVTIAPFTALIATAGARWLATRRGAVVALVLAPVLALQGVQAFAAVDTHSENYLGAATREMVDRAAAQIGLRGRHIISADHFGYVFADVSGDDIDIPIGDSARAADYMNCEPPGTVVLWDDMTGRYWYHLSVEALVAAGYRVVWERQLRVASPRTARYDEWRVHSAPRRYAAFGLAAPWRDVRQAILIRGSMDPHAPGQ